MTLNDTITESMNSIEYHTKQIKSLMGEKNLQLLVLDVVSSISITEDQVSFWLNTDSDREEQRKFINQVSRIYKVKLSKDRSYWRESLNCDGQLSDGRSIAIYGYVPPTCSIVEVEEKAQDWEVEHAKRQIEKLQNLVAGGKKVVKQVVCQ
jgi:hypothetical protein